MGDSGGVSAGATGVGDSKGVGEVSGDSVGVGIGEGEVSWAKD